MSDGQKTLSALVPLNLDIIALQEFQPLFPLPEAAATALTTAYTLIPHQVDGPGVAFLLKNSVSPQWADTKKDRLGHALTITLNSGSHTLHATNVYSKFSHRGKEYIDKFLTECPPDVLLGDFNAPI